MAIQDYKNAPVKYQLIAPAHVQEPWRVAVSDIEGTVPTDNSSIVKEIGTSWQKMAVEIGNTGVETTVEVDAGTWSQGTTGSTGTPVASRNLGVNNDGYAGLTVAGSPQDTVAGDGYIFDGVGDGLRGGDLGDSSDLIPVVRFSASAKDAGTPQVLWKDGGRVNGIAVGIDSSGNLGLFGRISSTLTSITITPGAYSNGVIYRLWCTRGQIVLVRDDTGDIVASAVGTVISGDGTSNESIGYSPSGATSAISATDVAEYYSGAIYDVYIYNSGDVSPPTPPSGDIYLPASLLNTSALITLNLYADGNAANNPNVTDVGTPPASYWDARAVVTWAEIYNIFLSSNQTIASILTKSQTQLLSMAPVLRHASTQILAQARQARLLHEQSMDTATPIYLQSEQVMQGLVQVALAVTQVMRCYGAPVALEMLQTWAAYDYNLVYLPTVQLIGAQLNTVLQEIQFSVTVAASRVGIVDCNFTRKGFCNVASLLSRKRQEWINKAVGDPVVLTVLGEQYEMIVVNKPQDEQVTQGTYEVGYLLECASVTCQLAEGINPDLTASRVTGSFHAGTMLTEILDFLTDGVCSYDLAVPDFPTGGYDFDDAERFAALREVLPEQYGWVIKTDKAGVLQLSQWRKPETGGAGQKTLTMSRKSLTPPADTIYTQVVVRNYSQQDGTSGLRLEVVDNGDCTGTIYGYSVPWTDAFSIFDSEDSPAPSLLITGGAVEEVEVEDTDVEFVDGKASLSKPCYSAPVIDWGKNDSLSLVTYSESGALTTATEPGYSVAVKVAYQTRRKVWTYDNRKVDVSQVRLKYDGV